MATSALPAITHRTGPVLVGQVSGRVLLHFDAPVTWKGLSCHEAIDLAYRLVSSARAAGAVPAAQRRLF